MFSRIMPADKLIPSLVMHYNCDYDCDCDCDDGQSKRNNVNLLFSHSIDTINFGNVKYLLTHSQMYKMYLRNKKSFLIEYRVCDGQFIQYFNKFKYNAQCYNCFAKLTSDTIKNDAQVNLNQKKNGYGSGCSAKDFVNNLIFLHMNKVFEKYWYCLAFDHSSNNDETCTDVGDIMTWLGVIQK